MDQNDEHERLVFQVPAVVAHATRRVADKNFTSVSEILRQALILDLRRRGLVIENKD